MTETVNLKLRKPSGEDFYNVDDFNYNADTLDAAIAGLSAAVVSADKALKDKAEAEHKHTRADISDFPEALPANGGNANTVGGKGASSFLQSIASDLLTRSINDTFAGTYSVEQSYAPDFPTGFGTYGILDSRIYGSIQYQTIWFDTGVIIHRERIIGTTDWSTWQKINDGGNAASANTAGTLATDASNICLRNLSSGTADATDTNCPLGAWYGQHD